ncbi:MAG: tyrosine-type recombinase/integrase, partial [Candidatus Bathyarchaeota archaeon]|nr:tyrosine-type recombinase/integrase [Candidatus Bathyarchaeota archaeon]
KNPPFSLNPENSLDYKCQGNNEPCGRDSTALGRAVQTLATVEKENEKRAAGATTNQSDIQNKIVEFLWWMKRQGYADATIRLFNSALRTLRNRGANLFDPESVKDAVAKQTWSDSRKANVIKAYDLFAKYCGLAWIKPKLPRPIRKIPSYLPTEAEIDTLIAASPKKLAAFLQLLKETAMRCGEAMRIKWTDIDFEKQIITLNEPEKGSEPRIWKVSSKLIGMLNTLPRKSLRVFGDGPINSLKTTYLKLRKRLAHKLQNQKLLQINFHTIRHWKATMEYHRTKDILYVKNFLGHREVRNTEIYIK